MKTRLQDEIRRIQIRQAGSPSQATKNIASDYSNMEADEYHFWMVLVMSMGHRVTSIARDEVLRLPPKRAE